MASRFAVDVRNWVEYRKLPDLVEVDFHLDRDDPAFRAPYWEKMELAWTDSLHALKQAQAKGKKYVLFTHGLSTSHPGVTTSRSQVRKLMRSKDATPYLVRKYCIQHDSVFVAAIRPLHGQFKPDNL